MHKVLVVDDDDYVRLSLKRMKVWGPATGYTIAGEAENGQQALELLAERQFDLVISDIRMPKINGIELLGKIVENKLAPLVVFLSEHSEFEYARQGLLYGLFDYLVKPVEEQDMKNLLDRVAKRFPAAEPGSSRLDSTLLSEDEVSMLHEFFLSGDKRSTGIAELIADKVIKACREDMNQAVSILNDNLSMLSQALREDLTGIDKFINWQNGTIFEKVQGENGAAVKSSYLASLQYVELQLAPYTRLCKCGLLIRKTNRLIMENIDRNITLSSLAEALFVNRTYLSELFKEKTGLNLISYITEMKMRRAQILISKGDMRICEIADLLGYEDTEYFSRIFKQLTGCSPSGYRRQAFS